MNKNKPILVWIILILLVFGLRQSSSAWNKPIKIAGQSGVNFFDSTSVKFNSQKQAFVLYKEGNQIHLSKYNGESVSFVKNVSESSLLCYRSCMFINSSDEIHIVWAEASAYDSNTQFIKYRYFNGSWSPVINVCTLNVPGTLPGGYITKKIECTRMAMDSKKNMFIVLQTNPTTKSFLISRYGTQTIVENWVVTERHKLPDVAVDDNFIHVVWQAKLNVDGYTIKYAKKANVRYGKWYTPIDVKNGADVPDSAHAPRITLDNNHVPQVVYMDDDHGGRQIFYRYLTGNVFSERFLVSDNGKGYYSNLAICVASSNSLLIVDHVGSGIKYNWRVGGDWTGHTSINPMAYLPDNEGADLSWDGQLAAVSCSSDSESVYLLISEGGSPNDNLPPMARFSYSPTTGAYPLTVNFNAGTSTDSDGQIVSYQWNFGDGTLRSGMIASHVFRSKNRFLVTLTVTDNEGAIGTTTAEIEVYKLNIKPVALFTFTPSSGLYPLNVTFNAKNSHDSDGHIVSYKWDFGDSKKGSGELLDHVFSSKNRYRITLTVTDDEGATSKASGEVEVFGLNPPLNVQYVRYENRNLFSVEYLYRVTWAANPRNEEIGAKIVYYKIYRREIGRGGYAFFLSIPVNSQGIYEYLDRTLGSVAREYEYAVSSLDSSGRESDMSYLGTAAAERGEADGLKRELK